MQKIIKLRSPSRQLLETVNFAFISPFFGRFTSCFTAANEHVIREEMHFKGCSYLNCKISFNLSVEVAIFLVFHNPFMMLFHILMSVSDHELMLDNFLLRSNVISLPHIEPDTCCLWHPEQVVSLK